LVIRDDYGPWTVRSLDSQLASTLCTLFGSLVRSYFQQMRSLVS
jgi:hypothetical protein